MTPLAEPLGIIIFVLLVGGALAVFSARVYHLANLLKLGQPENRTENIGTRIWDFFKLVFAQTRVLRDPFPGIIHTFIFWGFIVLAFGTIQIVGTAVDPNFNFLWIGASPAFAFLTDIAAAFVALAVIIAAFRRWVIRPKRVENNFDAGFILSLIFSIIAAEFGIVAFRIAGGFSAEAQFAPVANAIATNVISPMNLTEPIFNAWHNGFWWLHIMLMMGFLAYIPFSKHLHLLGCPVNEFFRSYAGKGRMAPIDIENAEYFGANKLDDFTWKGLLDLYACTECGRCKEFCPAVLTDKPLSPKQVIHDLKVHLLEQGPAALKAKQAAKEGEEPELPAIIGEVVSEDTIWSCTTCRNCMEHCPVYIEHLPKIIEMRRSLVLMESKFPNELKGPFKTLETAGNPWGFPASSRGDWAKDIGLKPLAEDPDVDILYWVGCYGSFDDRAKKVAKAFAALCAEAGVKVGILGKEEKCCGEPARMAGNEYLFQMLAMENVETLNGYEVKKIVTACPHCLTTLRDQYPDFDGKFEVQHHSEFLAELIASGKLRPAVSISESVTYHDPCYLGRYQAVYDAPRKLLESVPGLKLSEIDPNRSKSVCCGGGGSRIFMEEHLGSRINQKRMSQVKETNANCLSVACPFCLSMMDDANTALAEGDRVQVLDIAEVLIRSMVIGKPEADKKEEEAVV